MSKQRSDPHIQPRIIIHGGAGNIHRENLSKESYEAYKASLLRILSQVSPLLALPDATALDIATYAVKLLEDNPLFNCGKGAVFTRTGTVELESSVMVSKGYRKRGVGCMTLKHVKNPILLAKEMLIRGEKEDGGGAGAHCQMSGDELERLAGRWGLEMVDQSYFFTKRRWDEHQRGLGKSEASIAQPFEKIDGHDGGPSWDGHEYLPQGTVGAVVLDRFGTICAATSTGGLTNKLPGRIGDTPTLGAGFWAEEWTREFSKHLAQSGPPSSIASTHDLFTFSRIVSDLFSSFGDVSDVFRLHSSISDVLTSCWPRSTPSRQPETLSSDCKEQPQLTNYAIGMSGTGNGDSFLRISAVRTAAAISRFSTPPIPLSEAVTQIAGPGGELQLSAGDRWGKTGEGEGGIIGIELVKSQGKVVWDFNCGGMFRAWVDDDGRSHFMAFRDDY
ncbi:gb [Venturia nashicola]|uniref:Gb n=1 Tax=Venturia nashicola TaxID=86259 RepID=A0A4Z1P0E8_9PEZI|nr:gb [Venturia nashicola]TLD32666.1 gb [Venturia nashicola]